MPRRIQRDLVPREFVRTHTRVADLDDQPRIAAFPLRQKHLHTHLAGRKCRLIRDQLRAVAALGPDRALLCHPTPAIGRKPRQRQSQRLYSPP